MVKRHLFLAFSFKEIVMPIYEYQCQDCGIVFEEMTKQFDVDEFPCPECKGTGNRLISRPTLMFKGTGWTCTDGPPNKNWGKPSAAEDPHHNPGLPTPVKRTEVAAKDSNTSGTATKSS